MTMTYDLNKLIVIGLIGASGLACLFLGEHELASVCLGGLIGYLSKDYTSQDIIVDERMVSNDYIKDKTNKKEDTSDHEEDGNDDTQ